MSLGEIVIIAVVIVLVCKPEDIKFIAQIFYKLKAYLIDIRQEIIKPIEDEVKKLQTQDLNTAESVEEMNLYLQKIAALNQSYEGQYSLKSIKQYYYKLIKDKHE